MRGGIAVAFFATIAASSRAAHAQEDLAQELDVRADQVSVDTRMRELELHGHVHADAPPFHLSSDDLKLHRTNHGIVVEGDGRLAFCPCLGTPITLGFKSVTVAPPGDLFITGPRLEIFKVPVFWLPWFWLRAPDRVGLLPPMIEWRGADGLFLGGGVHVPWKANGKPIVVDLTAGGYFQGGFAIDASARTETTTTRVRFDRLDSNGLLVDARGSLGGDVGPFRARAAWDFDLIRGARGVLSTTDLEPAARAFDVGVAETSLSYDSFVVATGIRTTAVRGGDLLTADAAGPYLTVAQSGALGHIGAYDMTADASVLHEDALGSIALAHGDASALVAGRASIIGVSARVQGVVDAASDATDNGAVAAALARLEATLPLVRSFDVGDASDPLRHRIEPVLSASALAEDSAGTLDRIAARSFAFLAQNAITSASGEAATASAGVRSALGRWARGDGLEVDAHAGGVVDGTGVMHGLVRWRALAGGRVLGVSAEGAHVFGDASTADGNAFVVRARVGLSQKEAAGPSVSAHVAMRDGIDPVAARLLTDAPLEPAAGLFATSGVSGGIRAGVPWTKWLTTRGGVEMDLTALTLTAATGSIELRDSCGCFRIRFNAAHRLGREGVDIWTTIDLVPH